MGGLFSQKSFSWGDKSFGQTYSGLFYMGRLMIALWKKRGSFTNAFSSNTVNPKVFLKHGGIGFILQVIEVRSWKLTPEIGCWIWKTPFAHSASGRWRSHTKPVFFFYIFCSDLHFDALIIRLLDVLNYWSDYWRRYNIKGVCWCHLVII